MLSTLAGDARGPTAAWWPRPGGGDRRDPRMGRHPSAWSAFPAGMLAYADLLGGDPGQAAARSGAALGVVGDAAAGGRVHAARACTAPPSPTGAGAPRGSRRCARRAPRSAARRSPPPVLAGLAVLEHRLALQNGNRSAAAAGGRVARRPGGRTGESLLLEAWTEAAAGRYEAAAAAVAPVLAGDDEPAPETERRGAPGRRRGGPAARGSAGRACGAGAALQTAEPLGVIRPFALAGPRRRTSCAPGTPAPVPGRSPADVAAACAAVVSGPAPLLSEREQAVLALLPSLLNAREIADEYTVSVNTIKSHIRSIYAKLGVSSRREAVARGPGARAAALSDHLPGMRRPGRDRTTGTAEGFPPGRPGRRSAMADRRYEMRVTGRMSQRARDAFAGLDVER